MKIGIYSNLNRDIHGRATIALATFLKHKRFDLALCDDLGSLELELPLLPKDELAKHSEIMVVFGGDGTILRIAKECAMYDAPIFAVNLGHMGFLTEVENIELVDIFNQILSNQIKIDKRALINVEFDNQTFTALNEVVIARSTCTRMVKTKVKVDGGILDTYHCDGIIVSTPTGSTAYSLSAGGPIVAPDVEAVIITPICPHSLHSRPFVVNNKNEITIELLRAEPYAHLNIDGDDVLRLKIGDTITIKKSEYSAKFIRLLNYNYYEKLLDKMNYWSTTHKD